MWNLDFSELASNCYESMVAILCKYYGYDYRVAFIGSFYNMYYDDEQKELCNKLTRNSKINNVLKDILGIQINYIGFNNNINSFICNCLCKFPIGIYGDAYNFKWTPLYKKLNSDHFFLLLDNIPTENKYICADIYYPDIGYFTLNYDEIVNISRSVITFNFPSTPHVSKQKMVKFLLTNIKLLDINTQIFQKDLLTEYFTKTIKPENIISNDINHSMILIKLDYMAKDKRNFSNALNYMEQMNKENIFKTLYPSLKDAEDNFVMLKYVMIKYAMKGIKNDDKIRKIIDNIIASDSLVVEKIKDILMSG